tara:strand:- start:4293 stop:4838 length:546 start_codon:yes stop_codon:yes gene_type:complete
MPQKLILVFLLSFFSFLLLNSCKGGDARKNPPDPRERVKRNLEEGRGFRLDSALDKVRSGGGSFEFASSNELWRASLDVIDFMPLLSANYSGGIIITDWYSENQGESIKISIRFLSNEVRSDAIDVKIFYKKCKDLINCNISENQGNLGKELKKEILKRAAIYEKQSKDKNFKPYTGSSLE